MASEILHKYKIIKEIELDSNIKAHLTNKEIIIIEIIPKGKDHYLIINEELKKIKKKFNIHEIIEDIDKLYILIDNNKEILSKIKKLVLVELNIEKQGIIKGHGTPISKEEILNLFKLEKSICKISIEAFKGYKGTGFFCELDDLPIKYALFTNNCILDETILERDREISLECFEFQKSFFGSSYKNVEKKIKIDKDRKIFTNKELDYICIELFELDGIIDFLKIDPKLIKYDKINLKDNDIFILQFPYGNSISFSFGKILRIEKEKPFIYHNASTTIGSGGAPIIRRCKDNYIIGLHFGSIQNQFNLATSFDSILNDIKDQNKKKNIKSGDTNISDRNEKEINLFQNININKEGKEINKEEKIKQENDDEKNKNQINEEINNENNAESNLKTLKEELNNEKILNNKLKNEIKELKNELNNVKNKNQNYEEKIKNLQEELIKKN